MDLKHGSFFSGIGGAELAAKRAGWANVFHCEINPFGRKVLEYYFPESDSYADIKKEDWTKYRGKIDVLSGGFPCQPFSHAGLRKGTEDDRHLWPEYLRGIKEIRPVWVVPENVLGFITWDEGMVFNQTCTDLEREGFEVVPLVLPAVGVNAPHQRFRVWPVAYSASNRRERQRQETEAQNGKQRSEHSGIMAGRSEGLRSNWASTNTNTTGRKEHDISTEPKEQRFNPGLFDAQYDRSYKDSYSNGCDDIIRKEKSGLREFGNTGAGTDELLRSDNGKTWFKSDHWIGFPTEYPIRGRNDGFPGRLDGITVSGWTTETLKAYGNAWVPQVAYQIFKAINQYELFYA